MAARVQEAGNREQGIGMAAAGLQGTGNREQGTGIAAEMFVVIVTIQSRYGFGGRVV